MFKFMLIVMFFTLFSLSSSALDKVWEKTLNAEDYGFEVMKGDVLVTSGENNILVSATTSIQQPTFVEFSGEGSIIRYTTKPIMTEDQKPIKNFENLTILDYKDNSYDFRTVEKEWGLLTKDYGVHYKFEDGAIGMTQIISKYTSEDYMISTSCATKYDELNTLYAFTTSGSETRNTIIYKTRTNGIINDRVDLQSQPSSQTHYAVSIKKLDDEIFLLNGNGSNIGANNNVLELINLSSDLKVKSEKTFSFTDLDALTKTIVVTNMEIANNKIYVLANMRNLDFELLPCIFVFDTSFNFIKSYMFSAGKAAFDLDIAESKILIVGKTNETESKFYCGVIDEASNLLDEKVWGHDGDRNRLSSCRFMGDKLVASGDINDDLYLIKLDIASSINEDSSSKSSAWLNRDKIIFRDGGFKDVQIFDVTGQLKMAFATDRMINDVSRLATGMYLIKIDLDGNSTTIRSIKRE